MDTEHPEEQPSEQLESDSDPAQTQDDTGGETVLLEESQAVEREIEIRVAISDDNMQAVLSLHANPSEPYPFTFEAVTEALTEHGVVEGILAEEIQRIVNDQEYVSDFLVAKGQSPEEGEDARIEFLFDPFPKPYPIVEGEERVDLREVRLIQRVTESQPVARKIPAKSGTPGKTVTGRRIDPRKVSDVRLPIGPGTKVNENDPNELLAATPGAVRLASQQVVVDKVLHVPKDVDFSIGNIEMDGSVQIGGNVQPGFRVRATGDIHVTGWVEEATIESQGSIWVSQGILGHVNKTTIHAGKDVAAKFARNATISAGENITIQLEAIFCELRSGGIISVGSPGGKRGRIAGGHASAAISIRTVDLGAEGEGATIVTVAAEVTSAHRQKERELTERIAKLRDAHATVMAEVATLLHHQVTDKSNWTHSQQQLLARLTAAAAEVEGELQLLEDELAESASVERPRDRPKVIVYGTLFPGVRITIAHVSRKFHEKLARVQVVMSDDRSALVTPGI